MLWFHFITASRKKLSVFIEVEDLIDEAVIKMKKAINK